ncbi:helicase, partial [Streptomyces mirabilis]
MPALSGGPAPTDNGPVQPVPPDVQEDRAQGDAMTEEERETQVARDGARVQRMTELMRKHTKAELLRMAYVGGLVNHNSPEKWRKDEIASAVVDIESRAAERSTLPAAATACPVPAKPLPQRVHHDECEKELYE